MLNREDIESFLIRAEAEFQELDEGIWLVHQTGDNADSRGLVVNFQPPVVVFRADIQDLPIDDDDQLELCRRMLELNAVDLIHGAYGLEKEKIILSDTLELENLDFSEFRASLESLTLALTSHWGTFATETSQE